MALDIRERSARLGAVVAHLSASGLTCKTFTADTTVIEAHYYGTAAEAITVRVTLAGECVVQGPGKGYHGRSVRYRPLVGKACALFNYGAIVRRTKANLDAIRAKAIEAGRRRRDEADSAARAEEIRRMLDGTAGLVSAGVMIENGYARIRLELYDDCRLDAIVRAITKAIAEKGFAE